MGERSACIGFTFDARRVGRYPAPNETVVSSAVAATITSGSNPCTPKSSDCATRQQRGEHGENHRERADHPIHEDVFLHLLGKRLQIFDREIGVELRPDRRNGAYDLLRLRCCANVENHAAHRRIPTAFRPRLNLLANASFTTATLGDRISSLLESLHRGAAAPVIAGEHGHPRRGDGAHAWERLQFLDRAVE